MRWVVGAVILALVALLFVAMARTWRTRTRRQADIAPPVPVPADPGPVRGAWDGFHVATTRADEPMERVSGHGWGFRGRGGLTVHDGGVVMSLAGAPDRWVARDAVRGADRATWAIDRVVETGGLIRLRWTATGGTGTTDLDTYFRFPDGDAALLAALRGPDDTTTSRATTAGPTTTTSPEQHTAPTTGTATGDGGERTR